MSWMEGYKEEMATVKQRHLLYKLGYAKHLVHQLTKEEASDAIKEGLNRKSRIFERKVSTVSYSEIDGQYV